MRKTFFFPNVGKKEIKLKNGRGGEGYQASGNFIRPCFPNLHPCRSACPCAETASRAAITWQRVTTTTCSSPRQEEPATVETPRS